MIRTANRRNKVKSSWRKVSKRRKNIKRKYTKRTYKKRSFIQRAGGPPPAGGHAHQTLAEAPRTYQSLLQHGFTIPGSDDDADSLNLKEEHGFPGGHKVSTSMENLLIFTLSDSSPSMQGCRYLGDQADGGPYDRSAHIKLILYTYAMEAHKTVLMMDAETLKIHKMARQNPIWIQDSDSPHCKLCGRHDQKRRCHYCGWLVCDKCCPGRPVKMDCHLQIMLDKWLDIKAPHRINMSRPRIMDMEMSWMNIDQPMGIKEVCNLCYVFAPQEMKDRLGTLDTNNRTKYNKAVNITLRIFDKRGFSW
jgi:hypothetical protein